mgnify:CR=1 FL=1
MPKTAEKPTTKIAKKPVVQDNQEVSILSAAETKTKEPKTKGKAVKVGPIEVRASLRYLRMSAKKVRLVINAIKGLPINEALNRLQLINKLATREVGKLVRSAVANAEHNFKLNKDDLYIKSAVANQGPSLHRWIPAAFGSAHPIIKRSCHIEVVLAVNSAKTAVAKKINKTPRVSEGQIKQSEAKQEKTSK